MILYLIKSSLSLALLLACYYLFFRKDKRFLFNRCYLLGSIIFSLVFPFIVLPILFQTSYFDDSHLYFSTEAFEISSVAEVTNPTAVTSSGVKLTYLLYFAYGAGVLIMAFRYLRHLLTIRQLIAASEPCPTNELLGHASIRLIDEPLDPFSFGRYVLLNKDDYSQGKIPKDIIRHEHLHVRHRHTLDILFLEVILVFYWFHPLVWIYRKALAANHEYCADDYAVQYSTNPATYSHTLLDFLHHQRHPHLGSGFHYSLTKHRILMMQRSTSSVFVFTNKLVLTALVVVALLTTVSFTNLSSSSFSTADDSVFTVVVDAGHGGKDTGVTNAQHQEKDLVLAIAQAMDELAANSSIRLIYTRDGDDPVTLEDRVKVANRSNADLFLSLHIGQHDDETLRGLEVFYSDQNPQSNLSEEYSQRFMRSITLTENSKATVKKADFLILRKTDCPSVLLNLGFLSNTQESAFLSSEENQRQLASQIIQTITEIQSE